MTKLMEWVSVAAVIGLLWTAAYMDQLGKIGLCCYKTTMLWMPVVLVVVFGVYSVFTIAYRSLSISI